MFSVTGRIYQVHSHSKETKCPVFHLLNILMREIQNKAAEERKKGKQRLHRMIMAILSLLIRNKPNHHDGGKPHRPLASVNPGAGTKGQVPRLCMMSQASEDTHVVATSLCKQVFHLTLVTGIYKRASQHEPCRPSGPGSQVSHHRALDL